MRPPSDRTRQMYQASDCPILICPDISTTPFPDFGSLCPDKITHRPDRPTNFVRILYQATWLYCRGS